MKHEECYLGGDSHPPIVFCNTTVHAPLGRRSCSEFGKGTPVCPRRSPRQRNLWVTDTFEAALPESDAMAYVEVRTGGDWRDGSSARAANEPEARSRSLSLFPIRSQLPSSDREGRMLCMGSKKACLNGVFMSMQVD